MAPLPIAQISSVRRRDIRAILHISCLTQTVARVISNVLLRLATLCIWDFTCLDH